MAAAIVIVALHLFSHSPDLLRGTYDPAVVLSEWHEDLPLLLAVLFAAYAQERREERTDPTPAPIAWIHHLPRFVRYLLYFVIGLLATPVVFSLTATLLEYGLGYSGEGAAAIADTVSRPVLLAVTLYLFVVHEVRYPARS
ncbi:hypothetical protein [Lewinella sp. IMCC34183]|uniref:hypothetical protein n=1 Tax=Lewinella sp. IMCC34183 TaxID=2248762 RepID=UPI000E21DE0F|nr:hypothetical protein [Lewinella sp. IMCC34183]